MGNVDHLTILKRINLFSLPEPERSETMYLVLQVPRLLDDLIGDFRSACDLYDHVLPMWKSAADLLFDDAADIPLEDKFNKTEQLGRWMAISGRDGAMTIYHFCELLKKVQSRILPRCRALNSTVSREKKRIVEGLRDGSFPDWENLRHAVAHRSERVQSLANHARNSAFHKNPDSKTMLMGGFTKRTYHLSADGKVLQYELGEETAEKMERVKQSFLNLFRDD